MPHWSVDDEPAEPEQIAIMAAQSSPAAEPTPAPLAPVERVVEIIERFYIWDARLTTELLQELGNCSTGDLVKLFGPAPTKTSPAYGPPLADPVPEGCGETRHADDLRSAESSAEGNPPPAAAQANPSEPRWDASGRRLNPGRRAFNYPLPQVRGSHWSG